MCITRTMLDLYVEAKDREEGNIQSMIYYLEAYSEYVPTEMYPVFNTLCLILERRIEWIENKLINLI